MIFGNCAPAGGFHALESDRLGPFVWTAGRFEIRLDAPSRHVIFEACYEGRDGRLGVGGAAAGLRRGWQTVGLDLEEPREGPIAFLVDPISSVADDPRELGVRLRRVEAGTDAARFQRLLARERNHLLNESEFRSGATVLRSTPPHLRVSIERGCNVVPRCVYCEWDWAKAKERGSLLDVARRGLGFLGRFGEIADRVVDCSYGEPFLNKSLGPFLEDLERREARLELTCNGQVLGVDERRRVLGKDVVLYVSLDAATREGYARLRNDAFDVLLENLKALCAEKKAHGDRPRVLLSFIAMRSSVPEFAALLDLARDVGVDAVKLRALFAEGLDVAPETTRNGAVFRYRDEALSRDEWRVFSASATRLAAERGVDLHVEADEFGKAEAEDSSAPLCSEPWKTVYVLNRGIMPCCFGKRPIADMKGIEGADAERAVESAFNGPEYREIRASLARRELPRYCRESPSCPIVRREVERRRSTNHGEGERDAAT